MSYHMLNWQGWRMQCGKVNAFSFTRSRHKLVEYYAIISQPHPPSARPLYQENYLCSQTPRVASVQYNGIWAHWFKFIQPQFLFFFQGVRIDLQSGAAGCEKGFVKCFLRVSQAIGLYCSCQAAKLSKGNFQETLYKTFSQPAALDCTLFGFFTSQSLTESF